MKYTLFEEFEIIKVLYHRTAMMMAIELGQLSTFMGDAECSRSSKLSPLLSLLLFPPLEPTDSFRF
jgi:hypothetical protein